MLLKKTKFLLILIFSFLVFASYAYKPTFFQYFKALKTPQVQLLKTQTFKSDRIYKNFKLGGLSGLAFRKKLNTFYVISDDKKNHRVYKFKLIKNNKEYTLKLKDHILLHSPNKNFLDFNVDPEDISLIDNGFFIASEGQQIFKTPDPPQIFKFNLDGKILQSQKTASLFWNPQKMSVFGTQENRGFESVIYKPQSQSAWTVTEMPLRQDLKIQKGTLLRISELKWPDGKILTQYPYFLNDASKGLTSLLLWKDKQFLALERSYDANKNSNEVLLFFVNCTKASNIAQNPYGKPSSWVACFKKRLWSLNKEKLLIQNANIEGMALGPQITPDKHLLVLVTDNNFMKKLDTAFLFFEITSSSKSKD